MNPVVKETCRRTVEMFILGAACSLLLGFTFRLATFRFAVQVCVGFAFFALFQVCNFWLCRRSNINMWHDRRWYYMANLSACGSYALIGLVLYAVGFADIFLKLFSVTLTLTTLQTLSSSLLLLTYSLFYIASAAVIVLAKEYKYIFRKKR